jgi:hypothetical protein
MAGANMTDTPRTEAELLTAFEAGQVGTIDSQKVRDFVVSTRPSPLFKRNWTGLVYKDNATSIKTITAAGATSFGPTTVLGWKSSKPAGSLEQYAGEDIVSNAYSLAGTDPLSSYGVDVGADQALMLEPGYWFWSATIDVTATDAFPFPASSTVSVPVELFFDQAEYDTTFSGPTDGTAPYLYSQFGTMDVLPVVPRINAFPRGQDPGEGRHQQYRGINVNDTDSAKPFVLFIQTQPGWTTDLHLVSYFLRTFQLR